MGRFTRIVNGVLRSFDESGTVPIYEETYVVPGGGLLTGVPITLPASGTYEGKELEVTFNGQVVEVTTDYTYVGSGTKTQIAFTFDLLANERIGFRKARSL